MPAAISLTFHHHHTIGLQSYLLSQIGHDHFYLDLEHSKRYTRQLAQNSILPFNSLLKGMLYEYKEVFPISVMVSGLSLEQFNIHTPFVLESFRGIAQTGHASFLAGNYYNSLSGFFSPLEYKRHYRKHIKELGDMIKTEASAVFNPWQHLQPGAHNAALHLEIPTVLSVCPPELSAFSLAKGKQQGSPTFVFYDPELNKKIAECLLANDHMSARFALDAAVEAHPEGVIALVLQYDLFETGKVTALTFKEFVKQILRMPNTTLMGIDDIVQKYPIQLTDVLGPEHAESNLKELLFAELNHLQIDALKTIYSIKKTIRQSNEKLLLDMWGKLQAAEHILAMGTGADKKLQPSAMETAIAYMNICTDFKIFVKEKLKIMD